ncbi:ankyrin [Gonapodya prolifera JEL478]|uniref:Ankyrin n=1 Tax=Gonapodya prolifera (strain JEL478) TaxID=1344416 RepID=A0A139A2G0_GONPJ|nr:ankyrin [Gonapodya prolifera JEL478]|eukprot:KXS10967.1 ankyrin [Gonapodya prolifera JEL478]
MPRKPGMQRYKSGLPPPGIGWHTLSFQLATFPYRYDYLILYFWDAKDGAKGNPRNSDIFSLAPLAIATRALRRYPTPQHALVEESSHGNVDILSLLCRDANVNLLVECSPHRTYALAQEVLAGHLSAVQFLLDAGAVANRDIVAVINAIEGNNADVVQLLVEKGVGAFGEVLLVEAVARGSAESLAVLLESGIRSDPENYLTMTAAQNGYLGVVQLLLDRRIASKALNATLLAAVQGHADTVRLLLQKGAQSPPMLNEEMLVGLAPKRAAAIPGLSSVQLIGIRLPYWMRSEGGESTLTPYSMELGTCSHLRLHLPFASTTLSVSSEMSRVHPPANVADSAPLAFKLLHLPNELIHHIGCFCAENRLAFPSPALNHRLRGIFSLPRGIATRALRRYLSPEGALSAELFRGNGVVLALLCKHVDVKTSTAILAMLERGAALGDLAVVQFLLRIGADVSSGKSFNALCRAIERKHWQVVHLLLSHGATVGISDSDELLALAVHCVSPECLRVLLEHGLSPDSNLGLLTRAASMGDLNTVQLLLDFDRTVPNKHLKYLAVLTAARQGHADIVRLLLQHGAQILTIFREGLMVNAAEKGFVDVVKVLLGVYPINGTGPGGRRAILCAVQNNREDILQVFRECGMDVDGIVSLNHMQN